MNRLDQVRKNLEKGVIVPAKQINLDGWQDYRGAHSGLVVYVETSKQSVLPCRDQLNEHDKGCMYEPNYETRTYGWESCCNPKVINGAIKAKYRYLLFLTRYEGVLREFKDKYLIHGYMRIDKIIDARKRHMNRFVLADEGTPEPECLDLDHSYACYSEDMKFYSVEDSFVLDNAALERWDYKGRLSRQMKLVAEGAALDEVLAHFSTKSDLNAEYIQTADEFLEALSEDDED